MNLTKVEKAFYFVIITSFVVLLYSASALSISYKESLAHLNHVGIVGFLTNGSCAVFGNNNIAFRLPFVLFALSSLGLMYYISKDYFRYEKDRIYNLVIFAFLPGVLSASLLANEAIIVICITLAYVAWYKKFQTHNYPLLVGALFIDNSFAVLFLALVIYGVVKKEQYTIGVSAILFMASLYLFGFDSGGKPKGYFIETFAIFATVFSPLLFLYFFYSMYTVPMRKEQNLLWYIAFSALILALVLSLRQRIMIEDFAPFVVIAIPFMMKLFLNSMRVRLPQFRGKYYIGSYFVLGVLFLNSFIILYNKPLYLLLKNPQKHFAFDYSFTAEIADSLKNKGIYSVICEDEKIQKQLQFYGIKKGNDYRLTLQSTSFAKANIRFSYFGKYIYGANVTKINTK